MVNNIYGPHADFRETMFLAYQPMFELVGREIVAAGVGRGVFRPADPVSTATLIMTIYLGTASQVNEEGKTWLEADQVASFCLNALRVPG